MATNDEIIDQVVTENYGYDLDESDDPEMAETLGSMNTPDNLIQENLDENTWTAYDVRALISAALDRLRAEQ